MDELENNGPEETKVVEDPIEPMQEPVKSFDREPGITRRRGNGSWVGAVILIFLGFIFLLREMGLPLLENWWALFFLIPAIACFGSAWNQFQRHGNHFSFEVMGSLIGGLILTFISAIFLFNLNWSYMWPIMMIVVGLLMFVNFFFKR
jgi:hypothetical protein